MASLSVTLNKDIIQLFLHRNRLVLMNNNMSNLRADQLKHLLRPESELCRPNFGFCRVEKHSKNVVVHLLCQQCFCLFLGTERAEVLVYHGIELSGSRKTMVGLLRLMDRVQGRKISRNTPIGSD